MAGNGTHRERIELLERRFDQLETDLHGVAGRVDNLERKIDKLLHRRGKPKLTCPTFNGTDPVTWLSRVNQYLDLTEIGREEKVRYAAYYLEGEANVWWQWLSRVYRKKDCKIRWKDFEREVLIRFGPWEYDDYDEALTHIKQTGTLREYQREFEKLASRVHDWPEKALVGAFIGGLKTELASEVRVHRPKCYVDAIELARLKDDHP